MVAEGRDRGAGVAGGHEVTSRPLYRGPLEERAQCPRCGTLETLKPRMGGHRSIAVHQDPSGRNCTGGGHLPEWPGFHGWLDRLRRWWWRRARHK